MQAAEWLNAIKESLTLLGFETKLERASQPGGAIRGLNVARDLLDRIDHLLSQLPSTNSPAFWLLGLNELKASSECMRESIDLSIRRNSVDASTYSCLDQEYYRFIGHIAGMELVAYHYSVVERPCDGDDEDERAMLERNAEIYRLASSGMRDDEIAEWIDNQVVREHPNWTQLSPSGVRAAREAYQDENPQLPKIQRKRGRPPKKSQK